MVGKTVVSKADKAVTITTVSHTTPCAMIQTITVTWLFHKISKEKIIFLKVVAHDIKIDPVDCK